MAVRLGKAVTLSTVVQGTPAPSCQWLFNGRVLTGETNVALVVSEFQRIQAGRYSVVVSNFAWVVTNVVADVWAFEGAVLPRTTNGWFQMRLYGQSGRRYAIEGATNLLNAAWGRLVTNVATNGVMDYADPGSTNRVRRYYRAVLLP